MKAMLAGFAAMILLALGAWYGLHELGFSADGPLKIVGSRYWLASRWFRKTRSASSKYSG